jgi:enoyl-CoA hydratase
MTVRFEPEGSVVTITIDRPEVANAIDAETAAALAAAMRRFDADASLHVAVLTGANRTFCAGADLKALRDRDGGRGSKTTADGDGPLGPTRMLLGKPVIAAVEGHAVAGGLELALWCDMRVAARDAVFGVYCRRWSIPLIDGGTIRLPRIVGHGHALDLILTGRGVSGDEALRMGLVSRLVEPGTALTAAQELARSLAVLPQAALRSDRMSSYEQWSLPLDEALANEFQHGMRTIATGELWEGVARYASSRRRNEPNG